MNPLPQITKQPKGELQIGDDDLKRHAPDVIGKTQQIGRELAIVNKFKPHLDAIMKPIASSTGSDFSSRVKNPEMIVRKVIQKRMEDPKYKLSDINDLYGCRYVVENEQEIAKVKKAIEEGEKQGKYKIISGEARNKDTYHAYHFDLAFPLSAIKAIRCECQIMDRSAEAQAALTHDAHAIYSDNPPKPVENKLDKQTKVVDQLPHIKQKQVADTMVQAHKQIDDKPLPKDFSDRVIANAQKKG